MKLPANIDRVLRFAIVGAIGFVVDVAVLWLTMKLTGLGPLAARVVSFAAAAAVTYALNRTFTFNSESGSTSSTPTQISLYFGASVMGAAVNYLVFAAAVMTIPLMRSYPAMAVALGSVAGAAFNYVAYAKLVFSAKR